MKRIILWSIVVLYIIAYIIYENHRKVEVEWGEWKELTLDGANPPMPGFCFYCDYIKPLFLKYHKQETKPVNKTQFEDN